MDNVKKYEDFEEGPAPVFAELLARWNDGYLRGSQTRLANKVGVAPNTVSQWMSGISRPDDHLRVRVARILGVPVKTLDRVFRPRPRSAEAARDAAGPRPASVPVYGPVREEPFVFDFDQGVATDFLPVAVVAGYGARGAALLLEGPHWPGLAESGEHLLLAECSVAPEGKWVVLRREDGCVLRRLKSGPARSDDKERVLAMVVGRFRRV